MTVEHNIIHNEMNKRYIADWGKQPFIEHVSVETLGFLHTLAGKSESSASFMWHNEGGQKSK